MRPYTWIAHTGEVRCFFLRCYRIPVTHFSTKALFPDRAFPDQPCEETAGADAIKRLLAANNDRRFETRVITTG
jgi:hypothetical protein